MPPTGPFCWVCGAGSTTRVRFATVTAALVTGLERPLHSLHHLFVLFGVVASGDIHPPSPPLALVGRRRAVPLAPEVSAATSSTASGHLPRPSNKWHRATSHPTRRPPLHGCATARRSSEETRHGRGWRRRRWLDIQLPFTISTGRPADRKIELMRRQQGTHVHVQYGSLSHTALDDSMSPAARMDGQTSKSARNASRSTSVRRWRQATSGTEIDAGNRSFRLRLGPFRGVIRQGYQQAVLPPTSRPDNTGPEHLRESLTDGFGNLIFENGDTISVLGVPN